jgi:hypothetical protein
MNLKSDLGESQTFRIPLRSGGRVFTPGANYALTFTVKLFNTDADSAAVIQKATSGLGIVIDGDDALVTILRADTYREADYPETGDPAYELAAGTYVWDIQADGLPATVVEGECKTVNSGTFVFSRDITRGAGPTITIYTTEDPIVTTTGKSAYQSYLDTTSDDPVLSEAAWAEASVSAYTELTDAATADLPAINGPLSAALALKADKDDLGIPEAATITPITGDELAPALSGGVLGKFTYTAIKAWILAGVSSAWADITGKPTTLAGYGITDAEPAKGTDDNYVTDAEKTALHAPATVSGNGIAITGQAISLSIGTGADQVAAGDHTHESGTVDNATINAAIATDPAATRAVLEVEASAELQIDPLANAYFEANPSVTDSDGKAGINRMLKYLRAEALLPDDALFLRSTQIDSASPKTLIGAVVTLGGSPTFDARGMVFAASQYAYFALPSSSASFTVVQDIRGITSQPVDYVEIGQVANSAGGLTAQHKLTYRNGIGASVYSKQDATITTSRYTTADTISAPGILDPRSPFDVIAGWSSDGSTPSNTISIYVDGIQEVNSSTNNLNGANVAVTSSLDRLTLGAGWTGGISFGTYKYTGRQAAALYYARELTAEEHTKATRALRLLETRRMVLLTYGDSLSTFLAQVTGARVDMYWPHRFAHSTGYESFLRVVVGAQGGKMSSWGVSNYTVSAHPANPVDLELTEAWATVMFGTNDLSPGSGVTMDVFNYILDVVSKLKADGFKVLLMTNPKSKTAGDAGYSAGEETQRLALNALLLAAATSAQADAVLDMDSIDWLEDQVVDFYYDAFHYNAEGNLRISERIAALLAFGSVTVPRCVARPTISGTTTLTATKGGWVNTPDAFSYQWYRGAVAISGATAATRVLDGSDTGFRLSCRVTATNATGSQSATSDLTAAIE